MKIIAKREKRLDAAIKGPVAGASFSNTAAAKDKIPLGGALESPMAAQEKIIKNV